MLDDISARLKIDLKRLKEDKGYFESTYLELQDNLEELKVLKD